MKKLSIDEKAQQNWIDWLETQGEHSKEFTYTHKVETGNGNIKALVTEKAQLPKFKVGDWVVWDNKISCHVDNIHQGKESLMYTITDTNNMIRSYSVKGFDNNAHLWTIQDAKDGDVLVVESRPFIYDGKVNPLSVGGYCGITVDGLLKIYEKHPGYGPQGWTTFDTDICPATKEQRDLLFQKMKEAGYEWNSEKKELKKMSRRYLDKEDRKKNI